MQVTSAGGPQPRESAHRCALRAQLRGDPLLGTAFPASRVLLVEQPGPWGRAGLRESRFDADVATALEQRASSMGIRVLAIRRPGRTRPGLLRRWAFSDTRDGVESLRWGSFTEDTELLELLELPGLLERPGPGSVGDPSVGDPDEAPLYLVCAHSKHDVCCALRGRPVAAALEQQRPGRVWECSHLGGERFAANVLLLPSGLVYGRVLPFAAAEFVATAEAGEVVGALLRGRIGLPPLAQAAIAFAYEHLALRRRDSLRVVSTSHVHDGQGRVRLAGPHGQLEVTVRVEAVTADGLTCANAGAAGRYLAYHPVRIDPLP